MMHAADYEEPTDHEEDREHAEAMADGFRDFDARLVELARAQAARERGEG